MNTRKALIRKGVNFRACAATYLSVTLRRSPQKGAEGVRRCTRQSLRQKDGDIRAVSLIYRPLLLRAKSFDFGSFFICEIFNNTFFFARVSRYLSGL